VMRINFMKNNSVTLKQLADELKISKSYIDKIIRTLSMHTELEKDGNRYILNTRQQKVVREYVTSKKTNTETYTESHTSMHTDVSSEVIFLREQLTERNKEIENLHKILDQQQQLQLKTQNLLEEQKTLAEPNEIIKKEAMQFKESLQDQEQEISQAKQELEQKTQENDLLKQEVAKLKEAPKKGLWQRLFMKE